MAKLLPPAKGNLSIVKSNKIPTGSLVAKNFSFSSKKNPILLIQRKVIQVDTLLKDSLTLRKTDVEKKRKTTEQEEFKNREKKLEKQKPQAIKGIKLPSLPRLGLFDWIKNFVFNTFLGFIAVRLVDHLPKLISLVPIIFKVGDFIIDWGGKLLDGMVTFVDKAYDVVDNTRKFAKQIGGDALAMNFDKFTGALSNMLDIAVIAAISTVSMSDDLLKDSIKDTAKDTAKRSARGVLGRGIGRAGTRLGLKFLGKNATKQVLRFIKPIAGRAPLIGGLLEFGISWALGDPLSKAAFRGIGAGLIGAIGTVIGGPIGLAIGGFAGGELGGALYDIFFGGKKLQKGKVAKAAGGGKPTTRGGKLVGGPAKRTIKRKKAPRTISVTPKRLRPGAAVGGEKKIKQLFPESKNKKQMSPFDFMKQSYDTFSKSTGFDVLISLAIKPLMGDRPSEADYKNAGVGINNWMNQSISSGTLAYAGGGEVKMESIVSGEDYSDVIAKSLQDSVTPQVDKTIQDLMKQLMLKQPTKEPDKTDPTLEEDEGIDEGGMTEGQWGPLLDLIAGKESGGNYEAMYPSTTLKGATKMTIAEVARRATGAVGKYQQLPQYLVGRAKAAGLNPDKDLYSPENQEKIIINVNIKGRGGERWLKGEISDEEFMQGLSQEFASLPNAQGKFYYPGQSSAMTPAKVKAALSKVKKGGYTQEELAIGRDTKLKGGSGKFIQGNSGNSGGIHFHIGPGTQPGQVDTRYNADARVAASKVIKHFLGKKPLYDGRRDANYTSGDNTEIMAAQKAHSASGSQGGIDIQVGGAYDPGAKVAFPFSVSNMAYRPGGFGVSAKIEGLNAFVAHGRYDEKGRIAKQERGVNLYAFHGKSFGIVPKGGLKLNLHEGEMYKVIDKDSVNLLGFDLTKEVIDIENRAQLVAKAPSIIQRLKAISGYTDYEQPEIQYIEVPVPIEVPMMMPFGSGVFGVSGGVNIDNDMFSDFAVIG